METIGIIPARYASSRFPGKPLAMIDNKPMIQHVYERACQSLDHVYIATDDQRIKKCAQEFNGNVILTSSEHQSGTDRCQEAFNKIKESLGKHYDIVINIQGDEPFLSSSHLEQLKSAFDEPDTEIATLAKPFEQTEDLNNPNHVKVILTHNNDALYFSRSVIPYLRGHQQDKENWTKHHTFYKHIGIYAYRGDILSKITSLPQTPLEKAESLEQVRWLENHYRIKVKITLTENHSIDTPEDLETLKKQILASKSSPSSSKSNSQ